MANATDPVTPRSCASCRRRGHAAHQTSHLSPSQQPGWRCSGRGCGRRWRPPAAEHLSQRNGDHWYQAGSCEGRLAPGSSSGHSAARCWHGSSRARCKSGGSSRGVAGGSRGLVRARQASSGGPLGGGHPAAEHVSGACSRCAPCCEVDVVLQGGSSGRPFRWLSVRLAVCCEAGWLQALGDF